MSDTSRSQYSIPIIGAVVVILAVLLFVIALGIGDFTQPGRGIFSGRSNQLLMAAFALTTGLSCMLLFRLFRPVRLMATASGSGVTRSPEVVAEGARDEIMSDTAGELRTSVDMIQEELEEILDDDAPVDKEQMQSLYEETDRLRKIIDSMEQLSHAQMIARALKKEPLRVEPLLKGIIQQTRLAVTDREVTYRIECEPGLVVKGDEECIRRIIGNITDNAARSIKGAGSVTLSAGLNDGMTVFTIKDTGTGIRRAHLTHIYERFFRGTGAGIGMGLSIVKELVDACGGKIEVETAVGKGTTFTVRIAAD